MTLRLVVLRGDRVRVARLTANLLLLMGLALMVGSLLIHLDASLYQKAQESRFRPVLASDSIEPPPQLPEPPPPRVPRPLLTRLAVSPWTEDPAIVGRLEIPRLGLHVMIRNGDDAATLRRAVGLMPGTAQPGEIGNMVLTGHRDTFFRPLRGIERGDRFQVTTRTHNHTYVVDSLMVVEPEYTSVLQATETASATLITCFPFEYLGSAPRRFIVKAHLVR